jgi:hypothetical protein
MTRFLLIAALVLLATPAAASASTDGTSNTLMVAELAPHPGFMDYTDDVGFAVPRIRG